MHLSQSALKEGFGKRGDVFIDITPETMTVAQ